MSAIAGRKRAKTVGRTGAFWYGTVTYRVGSGSVRGVTRP
jgi:hypothetical protein